MFRLIILLTLLNNFYTNLIKTQINGIFPLFTYKRVLIFLTNRRSVEFERSKVGMERLCPDWFSLQGVVVVLTIIKFPTFTGNTLKEVYLSFCPFVRCNTGSQQGLFILLPTGKVQKYTR